MDEPSGQYSKLPPGWDCKIDQATGNCYYINYFTKVMQLEDPRMRYKQLQNERCSTESIPMQPLHASPYHVYPSNNFPVVRAFQGPTNPSLQNISASPLLSKQNPPEMSPVTLQKSSTPPTPRMTANLSRRSTIQETSFSNQNDTDAVVAKIQNMFPTAGENHIRLLLKKYMKTIFPKADETLLLDILANSDNNVQKASEKLLAMGYVKRDFVAPKVNNRQTDGKPNNPGDEKIIPLRPKEYTAEEKTEMKLRLQEKYSSIAERIILMALESVNYSEERAVQILQIVKDEDESRAKKDTNILHSTLAEESTTDGAMETKNNTAIPAVAAATEAITSSTFIQDSSYPSTTTIIPPLSSSSSSAARKGNNDTHHETKTNNVVSADPPIETATSYQSISTKSILERSTSNELTTNGLLNDIKLSRSRDKSGSLKNSPRGSTDEEPDVLKRNEFKSILGRIATLGRSTEMAQGPDDNLLLADYVTWNGANPDMFVGHKQQNAVGSDPTILVDRSYIAHGRNPDLCKGPKISLAKGSIYAKISANIKCN